MVIRVTSENQEMLISHVPWKLSEAFVEHQKHVLASPQVMWMSSGISISCFWNLDILMKNWRIQELHMLTGCHCNFCCIQNDALVLLTLPIIRFLCVWQPICLKYIVKVLEITPNVWSFHWGSWAGLLERPGGECFAPCIEAKTSTMCVSTAKTIEKRHF